MPTTDTPTNQPNQALDPAQLGTDASPETSAEADSRDMSTVLADGGTEQGRSFPTQPAPNQTGSDFAARRQQGAAGEADYQGAATGPGLGLGRASNGDEDRGYDQSGQHGGLGSSGGREDHRQQQPTPDPNPFAGGYDGGNQDQPPANQTAHLGLNTPDPTQP